MKIKFIFFLFSIGISTSVFSQNGAPTWQEGVIPKIIEMIPCDKADAKKIYVGNQPFVEITPSSFTIYRNKKKNIYLSASPSQQSVSKIEVHPRLVRMLNKNSNQRAVFYNKKVQLVNTKGKIIRNLPGDLIRIK